VTQGAVLEAGVQETDEAVGQLADGLVMDLAPARGGWSKRRAPGEVVIEQKTHWSPMLLHRRLRARRASTPRLLRPEALVIGEVPAWFLRDMGPGRVRSSPNSPSTARRGPSPVLTGSGRPLRWGS